MASMAVEPVSSTYVYMYWQAMVGIESGVEYHFILNKKSKQESNYILLSFYCIKEKVQFNESSDS